ncbi:Telomere length regulation protein TEL2-like protein [Auxenochlorella protothecoides]|uniref:Telomere length regulation protein TEL2-like protein n=1 Tax=Auxenochlorella protothecoides TaxID=3075 RepID=A0A087SPM1_AUXPR|nr:Telomere length regulation protein TEL2-like protein [Auxenochlorella protothecoides]KFM27675.1 Telomere length regulation protein TEL2-like protein [Auxenochlorella protothecoides]RMZ54311.1 hypothetical protein APUTEX25_001469 [Auxenochlorella protothecoides]|eukprot:RMZ54311.1 hypothetical protein APUTEX25_001469 [Auxenochlorella protothecoides]
MDEASRELGLAIAGALPRCKTLEQVIALLELGPVVLGGDAIAPEMLAKAAVLQGIMHDLDAQLQSVQARAPTEATTRTSDFPLPSSPAVKAYSHALLSSVAPRWLAQLEERGAPGFVQRHFWSWFGRLSVRDALLTAVDHLAAVQPVLVESASGRSRRHTSVAAASGIVAAELLSARFGSPQSCVASVARLVEDLAGVGAVGRQMADRPETSCAAGCSEATEADQERIAGALAALPDLAPSWEHACLAAPAYCAALLPALSWAAASTGPLGAQATRLAAATTQRLVRRGHAQPVGAALAQLAAEAPLVPFLAPTPPLAWLGQLEDARAGLAALQAALSSRRGAHAGAVLAALGAASPARSPETLQRLLGDRMLPPAAVRAAVTELLGAAGPDPGGSAGRLLPLAQAWAGSCTLPAPRQAALTLGLCAALVAIDVGALDQGPLLPAILGGVSAHLDSPQPEVRRRGMRVARQLSLTLDPASPALFADELALGELEEGYWEASEDEGEGGGEGNECGAGQVAGRCLEAPRGSSDRSPAEGSGVAPSGEGMARETPRAESDSEEELGPLTGTDSDDDDELDDTAGLPAYDLAESDEDDRLARALLHARLPSWGDEETASGAPPILEQRMGAIVATLGAEPQRGGIALASELYSPSLDTHQRVLILDALSSAALELAGRVPGRAGLGGGRGPGARARPPLPALGPDGGGKVGRVTWRADRSLQSLGSGGDSEGYTNRFTVVALQWASVLLGGVDKQHHGIDLFGRDAFLLGRLLTTLGTFLEATAGHVESAGLTSATLELVRCEAVHAHAEPYVRRAAVLAVAQAVTSLPPGILARAMLSTTSAPGDSMLVHQLEWAGAWLDEVHGRDSDDTCRGMAEATQKLRAHLAGQAALELRGAAGASSLLEHGVLHLPGGSGIITLGPARDVILPFSQ